MKYRFNKFILFDGQRLVRIFQTKLYSKYLCLNYYKHVFYSSFSQLFFHFCDKQVFKVYLKYFKWITLSLVQGNIFYSAHLINVYPDNSSAYNMILN